MAYVSYEELFQFIILLIALTTLIVEIHDTKKKIAAIVSAIGYFRITR